MAVREWVAERVGWVRAARARLAGMGPAALDAIDGLDLETGGAYPGREVARSLVELSRAAGELEAVDIVLRDIEFESFCEHHMAPIIGRAHIGYLPTTRVVGVSKLVRLVQMYAILKTEGDLSYTKHLDVARIDFCSFANSHPFRIRIVNKSPGDDAADFAALTQGDVAEPEPAQVLPIDLIQVLGQLDVGRALGDIGDHPVEQPR